MDLQKHKQLLSTIRGQTVTLPDFSVITPNFPRFVNGNYNAVILEAERVCDEMFPDSIKKAENMKKADIALFVAHWWPRAAIPELRILIKFTTWLYAWDDEIDDLDGEFTLDLASAQDIRCRTLSFTKLHLGLSDGDLTGTEKNPILESFREVGEVLRVEYSIEQRELFFRTLSFFVKMSEEEQKSRLSGELVDIEEFWKLRMGVSAVGLEVSMLEYAYRIRAPRDITNDIVLKKLWDEVVIIISITNDIISVKKELKSDWPMSLIILHFAQHANLQAAVDDTFASLLKAIDRFEELAQRYLATNGGNPIFGEEAKILVNGMRDMWVGDLYWHFESGRYGFQDINLEDGSFLVTF